MKVSIIIPTRNNAKTILKTIHERINEEKTMDYTGIPKKELEFVIQELETQMNLAAEELEFEKAAKLRDQIKELKEKL